MRWLLIGLLAGCYSPAPPAGAPCVDGMCPSGLVCSLATYTCEKTAVDPDGHLVRAGECVGREHVPFDQIPTPMWPPPPPYTPPLPPPPPIAPGTLALR